MHTCNFVMKTWTSIICIGILYTGLANVLSLMYPLYSVPDLPSPDLSTFDHWNWSDELIESLQISMSQPLSKAVHRVSRVALYNCLGSYRLLLSRVNRSEEQWNQFSVKKVKELTPESIVEVQVSIFLTADSVSNAFDMLQCRSLL